MAQVHQFELTGGALCLDFANTVDSRPTVEPEELLGDYADLVEWGRQSGALDERAARRLERRAGANRGRADTVLRRARALREALFEIFSARANGSRLPAAALRILNSNLPSALSVMRLGEAEGNVVWEWEKKYPLDRVVWPVVRSAAELLTSPRLDRVRVCAAAECAWLFLDESRNGSRRWCDMAVCGNRNKVRRFRGRRRDTE
jgi:predicted RNA-binding Zn ribbon-like protein